ncbi:uncharacterized protein LOC114351238 [Ostrinia furnacalis]|uniref:uncharacterized protein LOC114351238 n=1 Tax=Ostrinia furnacalis TaxID=93504 RepID=UPI00103C2A9F|nr:uncharacterized protein LOC114351238 [Ostrinia furnacalis]
MRRAVALVLTLVANAVLAQGLLAQRSVNYCAAKMCGHTNAHTFCQFQPGPSERCRGYMDAHLTNEEKVRVVARLNRRRSEAASGRLRRLPPAGNMLKLRWVEELAREAQRWADQCRPPRTPDERDACRDLYSTTVGQCVASVVGEAPGLRVESMVDMWYMQSILYKGNVTSYMIPMSNVTFYGDFAQMIWARSYMVGCGRSRFMSELNGRLRSVERLVCNFAPRGPVQSRALWIPAAPATACPARSMPDPELTTLCNFQRNLDASTDVDGTMSLEDHVLLSIVLEIEDNEILNYLGSLDELYLTKLAVVTMDNKITTPHYENVVHKRDIIETLGLDENVVHIDNELMENDAHKFINATKFLMKIEEAVNNVTIVTKPVKKAILIGRPKSYNIEELNDIGTHSPPENTNPNEDIPSPDHAKIDRDVYLEYALLDVQDENLTSLPETPNMNYENITEKHENSSSIDESQSVTSSSEIMMQQHISSSDDVSQENSGFSFKEDVTNITNKRAALTYDYFKNITRNMNETAIFSTLRPDEDYLTDPETVREIQEALDRMERNLEEIRSTPGKVRRELRDVPPPPDILDNTQPPDPVRHYRPAVQNAGSDQNKTDRGPMLNMVLKYMPYLKPYENEILGSSTSSGVSLAVSYVWFSFEFLLMCV